MPKGRMTLSLSHRFLWKVTFTMCFPLNLSFSLPLIILIIFTLFSIYFLLFEKTLMAVSKNKRPTDLVIRKKSNLDIDPL